ncbi:MAG: hypothetical protein ACFFDB_00120 [Promethearchaeota archaeon]
MTLEDKYNRVKAKYFEKREELEILKTNYEESTGKISEKHKLKRELTDSLVRKTRNKEYDDLTEEIEKIEQLDKAIGIEIKARKKLRKQIETKEREISEASQIISNMIGDLDYPTDKLKEDFKLAISTYPHLKVRDKEMQVAIVIEKKRLGKSIQMNLANQPESLSISDALRKLDEDDPLLAKMVKAAVYTKLEKEFSDLIEVSFEKGSLGSGFIQGVYLKFENGDEYVVTEDTRLAYQVLYWIYGDQHEKWMKYVPYGTRKVLDEEGADSSEYWDEVPEDYKVKLLEKHYELTLLDEGTEYTYWLLKTSKEKKEKKVQSKKKLTKKDVQKDIVERIRYIANNHIVLPIDRDYEAYITRRFKKQETLTEFISLIGGIGMVQSKLLVFADKIEKAKAEDIIKDLDKIRPLNLINDILFDFLKHIEEDGDEILSNGVNIMDWQCDIGEKSNIGTEFIVFYHNKFYSLIINNETEEFHAINEINLKELWKEAEKDIQLGGDGGLLYSVIKEYLNDQYRQETGRRAYGRGGETQGFQEWKKKFFIVSKKQRAKPVGRKFMRIRILDPAPKDWHSIKKKGKSYYIVKENEKFSTRFVILDVGDIDEPGIQGLAFVRGVPKEQELKIGDKVKTENWKSQAIRIEYWKIKSSNEEPPESQIEKALKRYKKDIINFLDNEYMDAISEIKIIPKDKDFKIELYGKKLKAKELIKLNSLTWEDGKTVDVKKGNVYLGRDVEDEGEAGYSTVKEIKDTIAQIEIDYNNGIITRRQLNSRLMRLSFIAVKSGKGDLKDENKKIEALKIINEFRENVGFEQLDIDDYLKSVKH